MSNRANDYAVWAYRGENNVAILCTRKEANDWWNGNSQPLHCFVRGPGGKGRTQVKNNKVKGWGVYTMFWRFCLIPDGPPLFWHVTWFRWMDATRTMQKGKRYFGTIEAALEFHSSVMATLRKGGVPDGTSEEEKSIAGEVVQPGFVDDDDEGEPKDSADWWKE